jgi:hypothetical protein
MDIDYQLIVLILFNLMGPICCKFIRISKLATDPFKMLSKNAKYVVVILVMPFIEELLFRLLVGHYLSDHKYYSLINGMLFGLVHLPNYIYHLSTIGATYQLSMTTYMGYYLSQFESFHQTFLIHSIYNASAMMWLVLLNPEYEKLELEKTMREQILYDVPTHSVEYPSMVDFTKGYKDVRMDSLPEEIQQSFINFAKQLHHRRSIK